jgi:hypothetical protein
MIRFYSETYLFLYFHLHFSNKIYLYLFYDFSIKLQIYVPNDILLMWSHIRTNWLRASIKYIYASHGLLIKQPEKTSTLMRWNVDDRGCICRCCIIAPMSFLFFFLAPLEQGNQENKSDQVCVS